MFLNLVVLGFYYLAPIHVYTIVTVNIADMIYYLVLVAQHAHLLNCITS